MQIVLENAQVPCQNIRMPCAKSHESRFCPAKINLMLSVTGLREDGFHEVVSLVGQVDFGDELTLTLTEGEPVTTLSCDVADIPTDSRNVVVLAAERFREATQVTGHFAFSLKKRTPSGAGLGGGSSNAAQALLLLNDAYRQPLDDADLAKLAASVGSDCPLFFSQKPVVMRGRGEKISALPPTAIDALKGRQLVIFKPDFGISTPWAYGVMKAAKGAMYEPAAAAEARLEAWLADPTNDASLPLHNNMEQAAFSKYTALAVLLAELRKVGLRVLMSGSGSACFVFVDDHDAVEALRRQVQDAFGETAFFQACRLLA